MTVQNIYQLFKIDPDTAAAWAQILAKAHNGVLAMLNFTGVGVCVCVCVCVCVLYTMYIYSVYNTI